MVSNHGDTSRGGELQLIVSTFCQRDETESTSKNVLIAKAALDKKYYNERVIKAGLSRMSV
jgi:hypothetical protein